MSYIADFLLKFYVEKEKETFVSECEFFYQHYLLFFPCLKKSKIYIPLIILAFGFEIRLKLDD